MAPEPTAGSQTRKSRMASGFLSVHFFLVGLALGPGVVDERFEGVLNDLFG